MEHQLVGGRAKMAHAQLENDLWHGMTRLEKDECFEVRWVNADANAALVANDRFAGWVRLSDLIPVSFVS